VPGLYFIGEVLDVTGWLGATTSSGVGIRVCLCQQSEISTDLF